MAYLKSITPLKDYRLFLEMTSGSVAIIDLSKKLDTARFYSLRDEDLFKTVVTDGDYVIWGDGAVRVTVKELINVLLLSGGTIGGVAENERL